MRPRTRDIEYSSHPRRGTECWRRQAYASQSVPAHMSKGGRNGFQLEHHISPTSPICYLAFFHTNASPIDLPNPDEPIPSFDINTAVRYTSTSFTWALLPSSRVHP